MVDNSPRYMVRYVVIAHDKADTVNGKVGELATDVDGYVKEGWQPSGGITSFMDGKNIVLSQALFLPDPPESAG